MEINLYTALKKIQNFPTPSLQYRFVVQKSWFEPTLYYNIVRLYNTSMQTSKDTS